MAELACLLCSSTRTQRWTIKAGRAVHRCAACNCVWVPDGLLKNEQGESIYEEEEPIFLKDGNEQYYLDETNMMSCRAKVAWVEVASVKDFPGSWAEYRVFEGGILQVHRRVSSPEALDWTDRTRTMFGGLYPLYSFGAVTDRCFAIRSRAPAA